VRKKELLQMPSLEATEQIQRLVREDIGEEITRGWSCYTYKVREFKREEYARAIVDKEILKVAIFIRKEIAEGKMAPCYEVYLDKKEEKWITYDTETEKWRSTKIDMFLGRKVYMKPEDERLVHSYFQTDQQPKEAILTWQKEINQKKLVKKHKEETDRIDEIMSLVPELPKNFFSWVNKYGLYHEHYMIYKPKDKRQGYCTCCDRWVPIKDPRHNADGKCPKCRMPVTFKAWGKQKYLDDEVVCGIMQRLKDKSGYVLRAFKVESKRHRENDYKQTGGAWEEQRNILDKDLRKVEEYGFRKYKNTGIQRWCIGAMEWGGMGYAYTRGFGNAVMYPSNLKNVLKKSNLKYTPVNDLIRKNPGKPCYFEEMLHELNKNPQYEYLIKAGLTRLVYQLTRGWRSTERMLDLTRKKPWECIKVSREQFKTLCHMNANVDELWVTQRGNENRIHFTQQQISWIAKEMGRSHLIDYMIYTTPHKMIRYLREKLVIETFGSLQSDYYDYLEECQRLGLPMDDQTLFPQNFRRAHEMTAAAVLEIENEEKRIQAEEFKKSQEEKADLYNFEDSKFILIMPKKKEDFMQEGREMHNCVGGYYERVKRGDCTVLFLRKKEEPEKSFCTAELSGTKIVQLRSAYNGVAPEETWDFMNKFTRVLDKRIKEKETKKAKEARENVTQYLHEEETWKR
jgi:hypothetical protein